MVYKMLLFFFFFSNCTSFCGGYFFPTIKILTPHNYTTSKTGATFLRQFTNGVTGVFHICKQFPMKVKVNTSHVVHPSLGMQVDAKCLIWQKCAPTPHPIFFYTPKQFSSTWVCVRTTSISAIQQTVDVFPAAQPESPASLPLLFFPFHTDFLKFSLFFFCTTHLSHPYHLRGVCALNAVLQMEMSHNKKCIEQATNFIPHYFHLYTPKSASQWPNKDPNMEQHKLVIILTMSRYPSVNSLHYDTG